MAGSPGGRPGATGNIRIEDIGDIFGNIFGRGGRAARSAGGARAGSGAASQQRGQDLETTLHLSFLEAVNGLTSTVNVTSEMACHTCSGSGAAPGTSPVVCDVCGGRGVTQDNQGMFSFSQPCAACNGNGLKVETPCPTCRGTGVEYGGRQVKVRIPPGVEDGQRIRVKGRGGAGRNGGPAGNLYVVVHVKPHRLFGRRGKDLTLTVPVSFPEAVLGTTITVPTLDRPVTLKVPAGSKSGKTLRVRAHGVPAASGSGDLLVTLEVAVPDKLTDPEREAVSALGDLMKGDPLREYLWSES
jgi:molecular chaperone DnaJ